MERHILSKTTFLYGCQCPKRLFLSKFKSHLRNPRDEGREAIFTAGTNVGELARNLFPLGVDASPPDAFSYSLSVAKTAALIAQGETIIYEAAFQHEGVMCALDIIVKKGDAWYAFEVKSTGSVKNTHVNDGALQFYVATRAGLPLEDFSIIHLNTRYVRQGRLDIHQLFATESILEKVQERQDSVETKIMELKEMLAARVEPVVDIGPHCSVPYSCDFTEHCFSHVPKENSIFEFADTVAWRLYKEGFKHLDDIPEDFPLSERNALQLAHYRSGLTLVNTSKLQHFLETLAYPLYFFDFESIMPGIPEFDQSRPYQQIPFQFSLHVQPAPHAALEHCSYLGDGTTDPRPELIQKMIGHLGGTGSIVCYNMNFERLRISELADHFPQYRNELKALEERIVDLMAPFRDRWYYHPAMKGSYSIKAVLPILVPELSYQNLGIQEGGTASLVYSNLKYQDPNDARVLRQQLLEYCKMDTLAMARIVECLIHLVSTFPK